MMGRLLGLNRVGALSLPAPSLKYHRAMKLTLFLLVVGITLFLILRRK